MRLAEWSGFVRELPSLQEVFDTAESSCVINTAPAESRALFVASQYLADKKKTLIITPSYDRALAWQAKLQLCGVPGTEISQLPSGNSALFEDAAPEVIALSDRLGALKALAEPGPKIVITSPQAALERTLPKDLLLSAFITLRPKQQIDLDQITDQLIALGYEPQEPVRLPGRFSRRGGILDIFPSGYDNPVRVELFDDEIETMRTFDPNTQRSTGFVPALSLSPSREVLFTGQEDEIKKMILETMDREIHGLDEEEAERLEELVSNDAKALDQRVYFDRLELYRPLLHPDSGCAADLLEEDDRLILDEPLELEAISIRAEDELAQALKARSDRGEILASTANDFVVPIEQLTYHPYTIALTAMNSVPDWLDIPAQVRLGAASMEPYRGRADAFSKTLSTWREQDFTLVVCSDQPNRAKSVLSQVEVHPFETYQNKEGAAYLAQGNLGGGFVFTDQKLAFITDAELFGVARLKLPQKRFMEGSPLATVLDLKPGDFVVHINFGIGVFRGLVKRTVENVEREFLYVEYQAPDKLFVPTDQLDRIQKYLNPGDNDPKLNKLTGGEWQRTIGKAKEEARAFARDLVKLYAVRKQVQRKPYAEDTPFQTEMEQTFPWVETPSQINAIREVKRDMEAGFPMDRLVCGDVGFGKTEVAIRAAFKAVQDGRQVAVLCPTTILAEQHWRNFSERLGSFGTTVGLINRFTHPQDKRDVYSQLKSGQMEMVVGTHSLLGVGIDFKNLGMVVIDEEHKFGVKQKEMLKHLRSEVDVLSMSATPIPRTLSMALMEIRQMSLINDPPPGRLPVRTFVRPYANEVVREAMLRELARGGQVFYVYNRVDSIGHIAEKLRSLVPSARIGVAHGQMHEKEIEPIMVGFIKGEIDILLSTTIIENGIDISNANTLIVDNADRLGLSQLYQLRGRVGRSDRQAYALFLYNRHLDDGTMTVKDANEYATGGKKRKPTMSENALARLRALQEFSNLGSGYSLAFRDLQIRGAGELLGAKQSGTMVQIGYELYTQLINEAVAALKNSVDGQPIDPDSILDPMDSLEPLPSFEVPVIAMLPEGFIKDQSQRLYYYQRLMSSRNEADLGDLQAEIEDRYGRPPLEVSQVFAIMSQRIAAKKLQITKLDARGGKIVVSFKSFEEISPRIWTFLTKRKRDVTTVRETFIWPYAGAAIPAIDIFLREFKRAAAEVETQRAALNV